MTKMTQWIAATLIALGPVLAPGLALAQVQPLPLVGDILGTDAETVKAALEAAGCPVEKFEAEDGRVEAVCKEAASGNTLEFVIDPKTGAVAEIKQED
jgi:Peptidase propeptide and YPEB domain